MEKNFTLFVMLLCSVFCSAQTTKVQTVTIGTPLYAVNGKLLFAGLDANNLFQLWSSDGTAAGTAMLHSFYNTTNRGGQMEEAGGNQSSYYQPIVFNNELYFFAFIAAVGHGIDLYKSDGTDAGTVSLGTYTNEFYGLSWTPGVIDMCVYNNALYFSVGDNLHGARLWKTTGGAPTLVLNLPGGLYGPRYMTVYNGYMYFLMDDGVSGAEVWKSDGTAAGTVLLKDIIPGPLGVGNIQEMNPQYMNPKFRVSGNYLYFTGNRNTESTYYNLYRTDGTSAGTIRFADTTLFISNNTVINDPVQADVNGTFFFTAAPNAITTGSSGLFTSDGNTMTNVATNNSIVVNGNFVSYKDKLFFDGVQGPPAHLEYGLFVSDGTTAGTSPVRLFTGGGSPPRVADFTTAFNSLFFRELYLTSPTRMSWRMVQSYGTPESTTIHYGADAIGPGTFYNGSFYFYANDSGANFSTTAGLFKVVPAPDNTTALPVTWLSFDAVAVAGGVDLRWTTAAETGNDYFVVERSADGKRFDSLGRVGAAGAGSSGASGGATVGGGSYAWTDHQPLAGANYYRIRQVDLDKNFTYSSVRKVDLTFPTAGGGDRLLITPNPVTSGLLTLRYPVFAGRGTVQIADLSGRVLATIACDGSVRVLDIPVASLPAGVYVLVLKNGGGGIGTAQFIKK
jgi:ELWxxDGT repeat protein